jgi:hypothetical protein
MPGAATPRGTSPTSERRRRWGRAGDRSARGVRLGPLERALPRFGGASPGRAAGSKAKSTSTLISRILTLTSHAVVANQQQQAGSFCCVGGTNRFGAQQCSRLSSWRIIRLQTWLTPEAVLLLLEPYADGCRAGCCAADLRLPAVIKGFSLLVQLYAVRCTIVLSSPCCDHGWWSGEFHNKWRGFSHTKK